jgi:single-strand DNA-binding protein
MGNAVMTLSGYLGNGPEARTMQNGTAWTEFPVGLKSGYGEREETSWVRCRVFGRAGETALANLAKGDFVACSGEFEIRHYQKQDGTPGVSYEMKVNTLVFGPKRSGGMQPQAARQQQPQQAYGQPVQAPAPQPRPAPQPAPKAPLADESDMPF